MARRVTFPLEMENGVKVRSLDELNNNFSSKKIVEYFIDGKLINWLRVWKYNTQLENIKELQNTHNGNINSVFLCKEICEALGWEFELKYKIERLDKIWEIYGGSEYLKYLDFSQPIKNLGHIRHHDHLSEPSMFNIYNVAFNQEQLDELIERDARNIYLYGKTFSIDTKVKNITYTGINCPKVQINNTTQECLDNNGIILENVWHNEKEIFNVTINSKFWEYDYSMTLNCLGNIKIHHNEIYILKNDEWVTIHNFNWGYSKSIFTRKKIFFTNGSKLYQYDLRQESTELIDEYVSDFSINSQKLIYVKVISEFTNEDINNLKNQIIQFNFESEDKKIFKEIINGKISNIKLFENILYYSKTIRISSNRDGTNNNKMIYFGYEIKNSEVILDENEE